MSRDLLNRCLKQLIKHESELDNMPDNEHFALLKEIGEYLAKPLPEPVGYTNENQFNSSGKLVGVCVDKKKSDYWTIPIYLEPPADNLAESYSDALRSLAFYVGCGGYNSDDPIDAKVFEDKIRYGIDLLLQAQSHQCERKPLSDDEIEQIYKNWNTDIGVNYQTSFARMIERAHGIKGQE